MANVAAARFPVETLEVLGSEHVGACLDAGTGLNHLLHISRPRRAKESVLQELGEVAYRVMYANGLWNIHPMIDQFES